MNRKLKRKIICKEFFTFFHQNIFLLAVLELKRKIDTTEWKEEKRIYSFSCVFPNIVFCCYGVCPIVTMGRHPMTSYLRFKSNRYNQIHEWWGFCIVTPNEYSVRYRKLHYHSQSITPLHSAEN